MHIPSLDQSGKITQSLIKNIILLSSIHKSQLLINKKFIKSPYLRFFFRFFLDNSLTKFVKQINKSQRSVNDLDVQYQGGSWSQIKMKWVHRIAVFLITNRVGTVQLDLQFLLEQYPLLGRTNGHGPSVFPDNKNIVTSLI